LTDGIFTQNQAALLDAAGRALVHFVWQGALVALLYACFEASASRASANTRYAGALAALALMLALPVVTAGLALNSTRGLLARGESASELTKAGGASGRARAEGGREGAGPASSTQELSEPEARASTIGVWAGERLSAFVPWLVLAWAAGVLVLASRAVGGWLLVRRLRRSAERVPARFEEMVARVSRRLRVSRAVRLCRSALVEVPAVVGHVRPLILVPASAFAGLTPQQLEAIIAHELAHVRRYDYLVNLLQTAAETLLFYHPAVWWVSKRARAEREHACDDAAVRCVGDVLLYARSLAALEQVRANGGARASSLALAADGGSLLRRIQRLVGAGPGPARKGGRVAARAPLASAALLALLACGALAASHALAGSGATGTHSMPRVGAHSVKREVAVTFVNFPGFVNEATALAAQTRRLLRSLDENDVRAVAFVNEARLYREDGSQNEGRVRVLREWLAAGHELGNETAHHTNLYQTSVEEFEADVVRGDQLLSKLSAERGAKVRYFSYPYLNTGATPEAKSAVERFLGGRGYRVHPVTIDNMDWLFNRAYADLLTREDEAGAAALRAEYVSYMERMFEFYEGYSREVVGREMPQVLMLTAGALNADCFGDLAAMMRRRGYTFVTLDQATRDDAYSMPDTYTGLRGDSWIARWAVSKGMEYRDTEEVSLPDSMKRYVAEHQKEWQPRGREEVESP
jgi:beta-lactamase regulating signal transducer with metallopeptidase domain/peptidoglycan/xylan/chitin deacetylase (PgdA/CDA1 family)